MIGYNEKGQYDSPLEMRAVAFYLKHVPGQASTLDRNAF